LPDLLAQRANGSTLAPFRMAYMTFLGAQFGLAVTGWLTIAVALPLPLAVVLDQTIFTIPMLLMMLFGIRLFDGASLRDAKDELALGSWRKSPLWRTLRLNWIYWALLAKPIELGLVHAEVVAAEDVVRVDAAFIVVWFAILLYLTHRGTVQQR
jgi:hypothetical protein